MAFDLPPNVPMNAGDTHVNDRLRGTQSSWCCPEVTRLRRTAVFNVVVGCLASHPRFLERLGEAIFRRCRQIKLHDVDRRFIVGKGQENVVGNGDVTRRNSRASYIKEYLWRLPSSRISFGIDVPCGLARSVDTKSRCAKLFVERLSIRIPRYPEDRQCIYSSECRFIVE